MGFSWFWRILGDFHTAYGNGGFGVFWVISIRRMEIGGFNLFCLISIRRMELVVNLFLISIRRMEIGGFAVLFDFHTAYGNWWF